MDPALLQVEVELYRASGWVLFATAALNLVLGGVIVYYAVQGYRRNASRSMLYLAVGIAFLTFVPSLSSTLATSFDAVPQVLNAFATFGAQTVGLLAILYAIRWA